MRSFLLINILLATTLFIGCNSQKNEWLNEIDQITTQLDSVDNAYQEIQWEYWSQVTKNIHSNTIAFSNETELAIALDPAFLTYYGPYSTAGKVISRIIRKSKTKVQDEISLAKNQLSTLSSDIKSNQITNPDSITIYIEQEKKAIQELTFMVISMESSLNHQQEAYEATNLKVEEIAKKIKSIKPNFKEESEEILKLEEPEHD
jgi:hypothetical protein